MYVYMCICMYMCMCVCMCVCFTHKHTNTHTHTHTHTPSLFHTHTHILFLSPSLATSLSFSLSLSLSLSLSTERSLTSARTKKLEIITKKMVARILAITLATWRRNAAAIRTALRYASISRSLLPYNRSLLTLPHTSARRPSLQLRTRWHNRYTTQQSVIPSRYGMG